MIEGRVAPGTGRAVRSGPDPGPPVRRGWMVAVAVVAIATIVAAVVQIFGGDSPRLIVRDVERERTVYEREVEVGERFVLEHVHSVTRRRVVETFSVLDEDTVAIEELWFDKHGANLPRGPEPLGDGTTTYIEEPDGYRVLHHGHPIGSVPLLVGSSEVDHTMLFSDGERLRLLDVARAGARIEVSLDGGR